MVWTRGRFEPDLVPRICDWFASRGFEQVWVSEPDRGYGVGAHRFAGKPVRTVSRALPSGDYGVMSGGRLVASVERKSLDDLTSSLTTGKLRYAVSELAA